MLAFVFGYALTLRSCAARGIPIKRSLRLAFASDTLSITTMEIVDNAFILLVPGAMAAGLSRRPLLVEPPGEPRDRLRRDRAG